MNKFSSLLVTLFLSSYLIAQTDSTAIKNKKLIEDLKYRINTIDNIGKGKTAVELELDALKLLVKQQNDSIFKLNGLLNNYARVLNEAPIEGLNASKKNNLVFKYKTNETDLETDYTAMVENLKQRIIKNPTLKIKILGHADKTGDEAKNIALSKQRAENIKKYLLDNKTIANNMVSVKWFGSSKPTSENNEENRRVEVIVE